MRNTVLHTVGLSGSTGSDHEGEEMEVEEEQQEKDVDANSWNSQWEQQLGGQLDFLRMPARGSPMLLAAGMPVGAPMAMAAAPQVFAFGAAPAPASAPGGAGIGFKTGGAQDAANFRENVAAGKLPLPSDVTFEGVVKDYFFDTSCAGAPRPTELFCPTYSLALAPDPLASSGQQAQQDVFMAVGLDSGLTDFRRPRLNLAVLLDLSGSMDVAFNRYYYDPASGTRRHLEGAEALRTKLDVAKEVLQGMLGRLAPEDSVAVCLFSDSAATPKRMGQVATADMVAIKAGVQGLHTVGCTNFQAGLDEAIAQLRFYPGCVDGDPATTENRIIVLTDAQANSGEISEEGLMSRLKAAALDHIHMTLVGIGLDFSTGLVDQIMRVRGANYFSVHTPGEFKRRLEEEFDFMVAPLVFDLELRIDPASLAANQQPAQQEQEATSPEGGAVQVQASAGISSSKAGRAPASAELAAGGGAAAATAAGGWRVLHVYGSPETEERRLSGGGSIMRVHTLFPAAKTEEGIKGGVVLLRMALPPGTTPATAPPLRLSARYQDRSGQQYNTLRTVQVPSDAATAPAAGDASAAYYQSSGVRKAVLLARLVDALQSWLLDEWAGSRAGSSGADGWNAAAVAGAGFRLVPAPGGTGFRLTRAPAPAPPQTPPSAPQAPRLAVGCPLRPPTAAQLEQGTPKLGRWERKSRPLTVNSAARAALRQLLTWLDAELTALGDEDLRQEADLLRKLVS